MPGPFPGRVVSVTSDKCLDLSTGAAHDDIVREMTENPHTVPGSESELKSSLALMVKRLVAEVRRLRAG